MKSLNSLKGVPGPHIPSRDMYAMFLGSEAPEYINKYIQKQSTAINPLTSRSGWHIKSPYNINSLSNKLVIWKVKLIRLKLLSWLHTKFSLLIYKEICSSLKGEF